MRTHTLTRHGDTYFHKGSRLAPRWSATTSLLEDGCLKERVLYLGLDDGEQQFYVMKWLYNGSTTLCLHVSCDVI
ncbi:hypothetical protein VNO78_19568 [Psophocarpus tetragonolobus]|uniref:Uncharacterized protein n=1 Tax=Psophocarpus tetragonolobus TaxID=3891 RepID=A0AAN9S8B0_PSOTE